MTVIAKGKLNIELSSHHIIIQRETKADTCRRKEYGDQCSSSLRRGLGKPGRSGHWDPAEPMKQLLTGSILSSA